MIVGDGIVEGTVGGGRKEGVDVPTAGKNNNLKHKGH